MDLLEELINLTVKFEEEKIEYALCGGLAMAIYAFPRATLDIDIMIEAEMLERAKKAANEVGFQIDTGKMEFKGGVIQIYRLTKILSESSDPLVLDMLLVTPGIRQVWESRQHISWEKGALPVISPKGLIQLKSLRQSGQDQDDIKHLRSILDEG